MQDDITARLRSALPQVRQWIDELLKDHAGRIRAVSAMGFKRLSSWFPQELLERTKVTTVDRVPFPPVDRFGLPELTTFQEMSFAGITFKDTLFIERNQISESLCFHELVHVVQWARLGVDNFMLAYGVGLFQFGYEESPLERMAYSLQQTFDAESPPQDLLGFIGEQTDAIWAEVKPVLNPGAAN